MENVIGQIPFGKACEKEALNNLKELGFTYYNGKIVVINTDEVSQE